MAISLHLFSPRHAASGGRNSPRYFDLLGSFAFILSPLGANRSGHCRPIYRSGGVLHWLASSQSPGVESPSPDTVDKSSLLSERACRITLRLFAFRDPAVLDSPSPLPPLRRRPLGGARAPRFEDADEDRFAILARGPMTRCPEGVDTTRL